MSLPSFTAAARRVAPAARCARLAAARGLASVMAPAGDERDIERDVAVAQEKAREARENPCVDVPFAAGLPETAGRRAIVRPVVRMRSSEPAVARGKAWRVTVAHAKDEVDRYREPLMGWTASAVAEASMQPDALEFDRHAGHSVLLRRPPLDSSSLTPRRCAQRDGGCGVRRAPGLAAGGGAGAGDASLQRRQHTRRRHRQQAGAVRR
jgi:hypothetical protein